MSISKTLLTKVLFNEFLIGKKVYVEGKGGENENKEIANVQENARTGINISNLPRRQTLIIVSPPNIYAWKSSICETKTPNSPGSGDCFKVIQWVVRFRNEPTLLQNESLFIYRFEWL